MNFSAWSIRNPVAPILAFVILVVLGIQAFLSLPVTRFPNIDLPLVSVTVVQDGASPAELERQVTREVEDAVSGVAGVKNVTSTISDGQSTTVVEFRIEVPTDRAVQDTKDEIDRIRADLPADVEAPIVSRIDVEGQAILTYAIAYPEMTVEELSWFVDDTVIRALQGQPGIGQVDRYGGAEREVRLTLDPVALGSYGITADEVSQQIAGTNLDLGGGRGDVGGAEQSIRTLGNAADVAALAATTIALPTGGHARLSDLGRVDDTHEEIRSFSRFAGQPVVTIAVFRAQGASEVSAADTATASLARLQAQYPQMQVTPVDDMVRYTLGNYHSAVDTLMEGAFLAVLVVLIFLRNWRATAIAAVALPLSAIPTFWVMDLMGFSLNLVSLLAITLATGILVDDAIVEVENISRHMKMGKTPYRAAIDAADEIGLAVISTSLTIVAVFVPVSFMPGIPGQYFSQFGLTVAISVLFSLAVARLITPMMAAYLMRGSDAHDHQPGDGWVMGGYLRFVGITLRWRFVTLAVAIGILAVSLMFMLRIPGSFIPPEDVSRIPISVELPPGSTLDETDAVTARMEAAIRAVDGVQDVFVLGGSSPTGDLDVRRASVTVLLDAPAEGLGGRLWHILNGLGGLLPEPDGRLRPQWDVEADIFAALTGIPDVRAYKLNDRGQRDIQFSILSNDPQALGEATARLEAALRAEPRLANVAAEGALPRPEVHIVPRPADAARLGITTDAIARTIRIATQGDVDAALAKISLDDRQIPIRVRLSNAARADLGRIAAMKVRTAEGNLVPLAAVADVSLAEGPSQIKRYNRERQATLGANLPPGVALGTATEAFRAATDRVELPPNVRIAELGDAEVQAEMVAGFANAMILGLMMVLAVLILLFRSAVQPFTILLSLPLALGGVAGALILTDEPLSMPVLIGILMLMGIVTKNAILLIDFAIEMRARGLARMEAVIEAGHKRARPIIMTSIAMSAGMLPSALGVGAGGSFRAPMAIAVIGGIAVSTVLSLVVVPSLFLVMDDLSRLLARLFGRLIGPKEEEAAPLSSDEVLALRDRVSALEGAPPHPRAPER
ncbi:efflux RND transporter permease subunit [Falsirhodobacter halotolerans]|uniref:efflux RND transporter permease subunit n=1 Tax=Falsirhodobacter halotolerans TaxID=1146892 RepID=UPI001FD58F6D|nr:efflux RND transporter permease subunit [Falsirhodobacter halotolerans]MCJ8139785.1 efflux RND transporter permease subunit [Falsirhodobacter halotolerans]